MPLVRPKAPTVQAIRFAPEPGKSCSVGVLAWPDEHDRTPDDGSWGYVDVPDPLGPGQVRRSVSPGDWLILGDDAGVVEVYRPEDFADRYELPA